MNVWSLMKWSISSKTIIFVFYIYYLNSFLAPDIGPVLTASYLLHWNKLFSARYDRFYLNPNSLYKIPEYTWLTDHIVIQFRYAVENLLGNSFTTNPNIFVIKDVLPHPVLPCRQIGVEDPFYEVRIS
jgi:hypothetical protein